MGKKGEFAIHLTFLVSGLVNKVNSTYLTYPLNCFSPKLSTLQASETYLPSFPSSTQRLEYR